MNFTVSCEKLQSTFFVKIHLNQEYGLFNHEPRPLFAKLGNHACVECN